MKQNRADGRVEIVCEHGVGHTTYESAVRCAEQYKEWEQSEATREEVIDVWLSHGCDGCCKDYKECRN